ncbi:TonB-dependent receptor [Geothrix sp. PMB-07]|uniref:TonB-dependent receptor n=1 Tax=Geothrix sp. PMB-07 TaxID=3068640 RepID=UPI0027416C9C|nr:TonB-dependent receptor [Geothrix sp. PMB-07]WLT31591.1 TonB-dependent receptor [Geothrix sp. PMB-07]
MNRASIFPGRGGSVSLLTLLILGSPVIAAEAAGHDGTLRGRVETAGGRAVAGAAVSLKPGNTSTVTDRDGHFVARELPPGTYTVEVLYMGLEPYRIKVQIEAGRTETLNVKLQETPGMVVEVSDSRVTGEVEALNQAKNSMEIINVLPAEVIKSLPNANVADAIGRLPSVSLERDEGEGKYVQVRGLEPRFTSVSINGTRIPSAESGVRQIKLDGFPSDLLGSIELHKTVSADLEGDAIGGAVNLVTKNAPDGGMSSIGYEAGRNAQAGGRYNTQVEGTFAQRYLANNALGVVFGATYDRNGRTIEDIEPTPEIVTLPGGTSATVFTSNNEQLYRYDRKRFGAAGGLDYRLDDNSSIYLKAFYSKFKNFGDKWVTTVTAGDFLTPTTTDVNGSYKGTVGNRRPIEETYSITAGGKHDLGSAILDYSLSFSHASKDVVGQMQGSYSGPKAGFQVDSSNGNYPTLTPLGSVAFQNPALWVVSKFKTTDEASATRSTSFEANALFPYEGGLLKAGLKFRDEDKNSSSDDHGFAAAKGKPGLTLDRALDTYSDSGFYGGHYQLGPLGALYTIADFFRANPASFTRNPAADRIGNDQNTWDAKEKVAAVYVKNTSQVDSAQLEYGLRLERTSTTFTANKINLTTGGTWQSTEPVDGSRDYSNLLPSVSWRYEIDKDTILRAVYGWAIGRPDYGQLVPSLKVNTDVAIKEVDAGNPNLKATKGINYDIIFERYLPSVGILSAGVFYKDLSDPIYAGSSTKIVGGLYDGYKQVQPINGPKANIYGFEVAWKQHLGFLPGAWSGLGIDTNYTHTSSKATFDASTGRTGTAALQRTAPDTANFGITYDWSGFSFRLAATYNSAMIFTYNYQDGADGGLNGPNGDTYLYPHTQIDAQASYTFKNGLKVVLSGLNLNNEVFGFYNGSPQWNIQREFYSRTFSVGVKKTW